MKTVPNRQEQQHLGIVGGLLMQMTPSIKLWRLTPSRKLRLLRLWQCFPETL
jgi:hypothetical protein